MKDLFLIPVLLGIFAFGYYVVVRVDRYIAENQRRIAAENRSGQTPVHIAAESPALLASAAPALKHCSDADPHLAFFLSSGHAERLLEKLLEERIDIVLLTDETAKGLGGDFASLCVPCEQTNAPVNRCAPSAGAPEESVRFRVVWKKSAKSKDRDRVLFALENEHCRLECGYADEPD